ncbi:MAG: hypothetical protein JWN97_3472 [Nocardioides sp.]|nr:hypothetical protein [Nocardioides sp.]
MTHPEHSPSTSTDTHEGHDMTSTSSSDLPAAPGTTLDTGAAAAHEAPTHPPTARRDWRRLGRSRKVLTAGAVVAGLAIGGAGFGAGYAVGDSDSTTGTTQTGTDLGDHGFPGGPMGDRDGDGPMGVPPGGDLDGQLGGTQGGTTGESPDFDGDGQPDSGTGSSTSPDSGTGSDSSTQQS